MDPEKFIKAMNGGFDCRRCGTCCIVWKIPVTEDDIEKEPLLINTFEEDGFMAKGGSDKPCPYYELETGCIIHETRPQSCKDFKASPTKCMAAKISTSNINVGVTVEKWKKDGIDEATILSRIYSQYVMMLTQVFKSTKTYIIGGRTMKDDLEDDFLLKTVKDRTLNCNFKVTK